MKRIYLVLTHTGTALSKTIKIYTKDEYSHISIALDSDLEQMYSFGRINPYNPFYGGLIHEKIYEGTFKRFKNTQACVYSLDIENKKNEILKETIEKMYINKDKYKFNFLGLVAVGFKYRLRRVNAFYCAEFVKYVLEKSHITTELPYVIRPIHFKKIKNLKEEYKGELRNYTLEKERVLMYGS